VTNRPTSAPFRVGQCPIRFRPSLLGTPVPAEGFCFPYGRRTGWRGTRCPFVQTSSGLPRSAHPRCDRGGCLLYAGVMVSVIPSTKRKVSTRSCRAKAATVDPIPPSLSANIRRPRITTLHMKVHSRSPVRSFPCLWLASWLGSPLGFSSLLHTPPLPATHGEVGTGVGHSPESEPTTLLPLLLSGFVSHFPVPFFVSLCVLRVSAVQCISRYAIIITPRATSPRRRKSKPSLI
jgi:hypothetical protein